MITLANQGRAFKENPSARERQPAHLLAGTHPVDDVPCARSGLVLGQASDDERPACLAVAGFVTGAIGTVLAFVMAGLAHLQGVIWPIWLMVGLNVVAAFSALRLSEVPQRTVALVGADSTS